MPTAKKKSTDSTDDRIVLSGDLNIFHIAQLWDEISAHLENTQQLAIHLEGNGEVDTSFLQLLIQLKKQCDLRQIKLTIDARNESVAGIVKAFNLAEYFKNEIALNIK